MNKKQRMILIVTAITIFVALLFPPVQFRYPDSKIFANSYGFLFKLPAPEKQPYFIKKGDRYFKNPSYEKTVGAFHTTINTSIWFIEVFGVLLIGGLIYLSQRDKT